MSLSPGAAHDLGHDEIVAAYAPDREHQKEIHKLFSRLPRDPDVISYRQDVLDNLLANPELEARLVFLLPLMHSKLRYGISYQQLEKVLSERGVL